MVISWENKLSDIGSERVKNVKWRAHNTDIAAGRTTF